MNLQKFYIFIWGWKIIYKNFTSHHLVVYFSVTYTLFFFSCFRNEKNRKKQMSRPLRFCFGDPLGARTQDPNIKSVVLYRLS